MFRQEQIRQAMLLYAVTDQKCLKGQSLSQAVKKAIKGGVTCVQLREKNSSVQKFETLAQEIKPLCASAAIPFIINDDVELAKRVDADGVHVGQEDMACKTARNVLGPQKLVGVSVQTVGQAIAAQSAGADYVGVGAMYGTPTKPESAEVDFITLKQICAAVDIPVVAIGGLNCKTIPTLGATGVDGVAVVSAIFGAKDTVKATRELMTCVTKIVNQ